MLLSRYGTRCYDHYFQAFKIKFETQIHLIPRRKVGLEMGGEPRFKLPIYVGVKVKLTNHEIKGRATI